MRTQFKAVRKFGFAVATLVAVGSAITLSLESHATSDNNNASSASYEVIFVPTWNGGTHPLEYPYTHAKQGLLTPIIGATHASDYQIFAKGMKPSPGLERLSEMGKHDPLDAEIRQAIAAGKAGSLIQFSDGSPGPVHAAVSATFEIDKKFPMVSLVGMIAPSPDWFYGVSGVQLREGNGWVASVTQTVYAWDSGGDSGNTYMAEDADLNPKQSTRYADSAHFMRDGKRVPVGVLVFKRVPSSVKVTGS